MEQGGAAAAKLPLAASRLQQLDSLRLQQQVRSSAAGGGCGAVPGCHTATIASGCPIQSLYALTCRLLTCLCRKASHPSSITSSLVVGKLAQWYVRPRPPSASRMPSLTSPFPRHQPRTCTAAPLLTLISCHPAVQGAAERRLSRGKGAPDHVRGGSACRRLIRMAPES